MAFTLSSPAFPDGHAIPPEYTCQGEDVSPPLAWTGVPEKARSLALIVEDPDAPDPRAPRMVWVHWVLFDLPPTAGGLARGVSALPEGTQQGLTDFGRVGYGGPCPPVGRHRYFHRLYALDLVLGPARPLTATELRKAFAGHQLAEAVLMGTYEKVR